MHVRSLSVSGDLPERVRWSGRWSGCSADAVPHQRKLPGSVERRAEAFWLCDCFVFMHGTT